MDLASGAGMAVEILVAAVLAYAGMLAVLRVSGKRTLAKWNAFDFIVTIALGSALATTIVSRQTPPLQGIVAFAALVGLQLALTWLALRLPLLERALKSRPVALLRDGELCREAMRRERVTDGEVRAAVRGKGYARMQDVVAVVLETDGSISVIARTPGQATALADVEGAPL